MKTLLIFLLGVSLVAGLFLSRPSQKSFSEALAAKSGEGDGNVVTKLVNKGAAELDAKVDDMVQQLLQKGAYALARTKRLCNRKLVER